MITTFQLLATIFPCVSTLTIDDKFIRDLVNSQGLEQCDFGYVTDYKESKIVNQIFADGIDERLFINSAIYVKIYELANYITQHSNRPIMIKSFSTPKEDIFEVLPNHSACLIHFLHTYNLNLTLHYLKSAWRAGFISANHFYLVAYTKPTHDREILNLREVFDFQRLFLLSTKVTKLITFN